MSCRGIVLLVRLIQEFAAISDTKLDDLMGYIDKKEFTNMKKWVARKNLIMNLHRLCVKYMITCIHI